MKTFLEFFALDVVHRKYPRNAELALKVARNAANQMGLDLKKKNPNYAQKINSIIYNQGSSN